MDEISKITQLLNAGGLIAGLVFVLIGGYRRWWVWGYQLTDMTAERDKERENSAEWKILFLRTIRVTETAVTVAKQQVKDGV